MKHPFVLEGSTWDGGVTLWYSHKGKLFPVRHWTALEADHDDFDQMVAKTAEEYVEREA